MKTSLTNGLLSVMSLSCGLLITSCQKTITEDEVMPTAELAVKISTEATRQQAIGVSARLSNTGDSIYVVDAALKTAGTTPVAVKDMPAAVETYLTAHYNGYTHAKSVVIKEAGKVKGYVVVVQYNGKPVAMLFNAEGAFVKVLEQREGRDLLYNRSWHAGGFFEDRNNKGKDQIALNAIPMPVLQYFKTHFPADKIVNAFKNKDNSILIISTNSNGLHATVFNIQKQFIKRERMHQHITKVVKADDLPVVIKAYLANTYPSYTYKIAHAGFVSNELKGFVVVIDANNTKYAVMFNAKGGFEKVVVIR